MLCRRICTCPQNGAILNARQNLAEKVDEFGLTGDIERRYPLLVQCCREGAACITEVQVPNAQMAPDPQPTLPEDSIARFAAWWAELPVGSRRLDVCCAVWCMSKNSTVIVSSYQATSKLVCPQYVDGVAIVDQARTLLEFAQVARKYGWLEKTEMQFLRKVDMAEDREVNIAFCDCLRVFRVTSMADSETYARCHLRASDALNKRYNPLPAGFPVHGGTAAHVLGVWVQDDQAHGTRNAECIIKGVGAPAQPRGRG